MNHKIYLIVIVCFVFSCENSSKEKLKPQEILNKSFTNHDPDSEWSSLQIVLNIAEPRTSNPERFSKVKLNNSTGEFSLERTKNNRLVSYSVNQAGEVLNSLDGKYISDSTLINEYRLQKERTPLYKGFYELMLGLPMSLTGQVEEVVGLEEVSFGDKAAYKLLLKLKNSVISDYWNILISVEDYSLLGLEIIFPEDNTKGELILMDGELSLGNNINIPRFRHWYELHDKSSYSGSDILIEEVK